MPRPLQNLSARHRQAIRLLVAGADLHTAAEATGLSPNRLCTVRHTDVGQAFALHLESLANDYIARMLALGIVPEHIARAVGQRTTDDNLHKPRKRSARGRVWADREAARQARQVQEDGVIQALRDAEQQHEADDEWWQREGRWLAW